MCTHKRWITTSLGKRMFVKCGQCAACLQEKAIARANRIRNNYAYDGSNYALFVTLTYRNACVPYILPSELRSSEIVREVVDHDLKGDIFEDVRYVNIYRNTICSRRFKKGFKMHKVVIDQLRVPAKFDVTAPLPLLRNDKTEFQRVSVCHYRDLQNFYKRLRQNLSRKYDYNNLHFTYYSCSEYGKTTKRCHFHILLFSPSSVPVSFWKTAISEAWPYDGYNLTKRNIEVARDAAAYVAGYVNKSASVPLFFKMVDDARQRHSYSKGFALGKDWCTLSQVLKAFRDRDLKYDSVSFKQGILFVERMLLPQYVISRWFPKFKGYSRLTVDEIESVLLRPTSITAFSKRCDYTKEDCHRIAVMLFNKRAYALEHGIDLQDYIDCYKGIWQLYSSQLMRLFYDDISSVRDYFEAYDNIAELYSGDVDSDLSNCYYSLPKSFSYEVDSNKFRANVRKTDNLAYWHDVYEQDKAVRNEIYARQGLHF